MIDVNNDLSQKFSKGTRIIHWITALLIIILFPLGKYMDEIPIAEKLGLIQIHAILGTVVLLLTLFRIYLFFKAPRPADLKTGSKINDLIAVWNHNALYLFLLGASISGIITLLIGGYRGAIVNNDPTLVKPHSEIFSLEGHEIFVLLIVLFFVLHVLGVIKHYILTKENTLKRIF
jgi:cytochrome b561